MHFAIWLVAISMFVNTAASASSTRRLFDLLGEKPKSLDNLIESYREQGNVVGLSVGLFNQQGLLWARGFGFADKENNIPADPVILYRVGSLTKPITATAVLHMEDSNKLDIDQPVEMYLERFQVKSRFTGYSLITARNLITHHSGLPTNIDKGQWSSTDFTAVIEQLRSEYTAYPADYVHNYSNVGYSVLGCLIEEVAQQDYQSYIQDMLFQPLGMHYSTFDSSTAPQRILAKGYRDGKVQTLLPIRDKPAMGLYSNVLDMGRFVTMLLRNGNYRDIEVVADATARELSDRQNDTVALDFDFAMGLGFFLNQTVDERFAVTLEHGGSTLNFGSYMIVSPDENLGIVVLANTSGSRQTAQKIATALFKRLILPQDQILALEKEALTRQPEPSDPRKKMATYVTQAGLISISTEEDQMCACSNRKTLDLVPMPDGWYGVYNANESARKSAKPLLKIRRKLINGKSVVVMDRDGKEMRFGALMPSDPIPDIWLQRTGKFKVINADPGYPVEEAQLIHLEQRLFLHYKMPALSKSAIEVPITPVSDTEAITVGLGSSRGTTLRVINVDGTEHLLFSGYLLEPVNRDDLAIH